MNVTLRETKDEWAERMGREHPDTLLFDDMYEEDGEA